MSIGIASAPELQDNDKKDRARQQHACDSFRRRSPYRFHFSCDTSFPRLSLVVTPDLNEVPNARVYGDRLVRFYTGLEDAEDLIHDVEQALSAVA
jgi:hypothetical protein